ncbi:MAG TPA: sulfotransferase [Solirubrobacterales bacterium]|nr:sulfotransferase [Solirubrobacterales bacterium]
MEGLSENEDRLAWIFGSSRSGSTWLLRMLSDLHGVVPIDDPHLGHHLGVWRPIPLAWAACDDPPPLSTLLEVKEEEPGYFFADRHRDAWWRPLRDLICARFEAQAGERPGDLGETELFVVKEPGSQVAPLLAEMFPASKMIFLLRDGRDVVDSWLDAYREGSWAIPGGAFPVAPEGRLALIRWLSAVWVYRSRAVRNAFESRSPEDRILIRYEDLREEATVYLDQLCAMLGLDRSEVREVAGRHRFESVPAADRGPGQAIRSAAPGSWRENLTAAEKAAMDEVLGAALAEFGYGEKSAARQAAGVL